MFRLWTDYPIKALGDMPYEEAPIRECKIVRWINEKWLIAEAEGVQFETKRFYIYTEPGRSGAVPHLEANYE